MTAPPPHAVHPRRRWIALVVVCFAMLMNTLDQTIVNVALPTIQRSLHVNQSSLAWVVDAYLISFGGALIVAGRLGDLIGRKRVFLAGVALFTLSSAACGAAGSEAVLVAARFTQGLGAAFSSSAILAIIVAEFPAPGERTRAMNAYLVVAVGGGSLGLLLGGLVTQALSWHWIFFINLPIGAATFFAGIALIDENVGLGIRAGLDVGGAVLSTGGMMLAIYAIVTSSQYGWGSAHTGIFGGAAIVVLAAFAVLERRLRNPMMPGRVLRSPGLLASSTLRGLMVVGMYGTFFIGVLYLQHVLGYDAIHTGLAFLPQTLTVGLMTLGVTARFMHRITARQATVAGLAILVVGLLLMATAGLHTPYLPQLFLAFFLVGLGVSICFTPLLVYGIAGVAVDDAGLASGILNVSQQLSAAVAVAVLGSIATQRTTALQAAGRSMVEALDGGYRLAFFVSAGCVAAALVLAVPLIRRRSPHIESGAADDSEQAQLIVEGL